MPNEFVARRTSRTGRKSLRTSSFSRVRYHHRFENKRLDFWARLFGGLDASFYILSRDSRAQNEGRANLQWRIRTIHTLRTPYPTSSGAMYDSEIRLSGLARMTRCYLFAQRKARELRRRSFTRGSVQSSRRAKRRTQRTGS